MQAEAVTQFGTIPADLKDCPVLSLREVYPNRKDERKGKSNCITFVDVSNRNLPHEADDVVCLFDQQLHVMDDGILLLLKCNVDHAYLMYLHSIKTKSLLSRFGKSLYIIICSKCTQLQKV